MTSDEQEWLKKVAKDGKEDFWSNLFDTLEPSLTNLCLPSCAGSHCCCPVFSVGNVVVGHALDFILVQSHSDPSKIACSDAHYSFDSLVGIPNCFLNLQNANVSLQLANFKVVFPINNKGKFQAPQSKEGLNMQMKRGEQQSEDSRKATSGLDHDILALQTLAECCTFGEATGARIVIRCPDSSRILAVAPCSIYFWSSLDRIFVCDIDGTITKSNLRGLLDSVVTQQYSFCHDGICQFLQSLLEEDEGLLYGNNGSSKVRILYLTSRPVELAFSTRAFLRNLRQPQRLLSKPNISVQLPEGPLLGFTEGLRKIMYMELVTHNVHEFKTQALQNVAKLWQQVNCDMPFWSGLGNTFMDAKAYHSAGIELNCIYIINKQSEIHCLDRAPAVATQVLGLAAGMDKEDYKLARRTIFPLGYLDKNLIGHVKSDHKIAPVASIV